MPRLAAVAALVLILASSLASAATNCSYQNTFNLCIRNWNSGGTTSSCTPKTGDAYNYCMCQQYTAQVYCYNSFCPQDPNTATLRDYASSYCAKVPANFTGSATLSFSSALPTSALSGDGSSTTDSATGVTLGLPATNTASTTTLIPGAATREAAVSLAVAAGVAALAALAVMVGSV